MLHIEEITEESAFSALRDEWNALAERTPALSVFNQWDWQHAWWTFYGAGRPLHLITVRLDGQLVGVLPLYVQDARVLKIGTIKRLRMVGTGGDTTPDYLDPLVEPACAAQVREAMLKHAIEHIPGWDTLLLSDCLGVQDWHQLAEKLSESARLRIERKVCACIQYVTLPSNWDGYLASLTKGFRKFIRASHRKFEAAGGRFFVLENAADLDRVIDRLIQLHHLRWQGRNKHHAFSSENYIHFHREVMHRCFKRGWLRLACLEVQGELIAVDYTYVYDGSVFDFQGGFDPAYAKLSPGTVVRSMNLQDAIARGLRVYDMLRGEYDYKNRWGCQSRETGQIELVRPTLNGRFYLFQERQVMVARQHLGAAWRAVRAAAVARWPRTVEDPTIDPDL